MRDDIAEALAITDSALEIDRERHDELAVAGDLANRGQILKSMGEYELARASLEEAIAIPAQAAEPATLTYTLHMLANICRSQGDLEQCDAHICSGRMRSRNGTCGRSCAPST